MGRGYVSPRRRAMAEQTRADVVAAVGDELEGPLIELCERVARRAGVSAATVRKLFPRREALLAAGFDHVVDAVQPPDPASATGAEPAVEAVFAYFDALGVDRLWAAYRHAEESDALQERLGRVEGAVEAVITRLSRGDRGAAALARTLLHPLAYRRLRLGGVDGPAARAQVAMAITTGTATNTRRRHGHEAGSSHRAR